MHCLSLCVCEIVNNLKEILLFPNTNFQIYNIYQNKWISWIFYNLICIFEFLKYIITILYIISDLKMELLKIV